MTAADTMYALVSPHVHQLLRRHCGRGLPKYLSWLEDTIANQLLR